VAWRKTREPLPLLLLLLPAEMQPRFVPSTSSTTGTAGVLLLVLSAQLSAL
jgi:hypothetical protein